MTRFPMDDMLRLRLRVEDFIYQEAALLDGWKLREWLALFAADCRYEVAPTGEVNAGELSSADVLFLVADDRERLEQRVVRLMKPQAHAEYPHSRLRRLYGNVRIISAADGVVAAESNFVTFRTKRSITSTYMGWHRWILQPSGDSFLVQRKRVVLDLDGLVPQGKVSMIL